MVIALYDNPSVGWTPTSSPPAGRSALRRELLPMIVYDRGLCLAVTSYAAMQLMGEASSGLASHDNYRPTMSTASMSRVASLTKMALAPP